MTLFKKTGLFFFQWLIAIVILGLAAYAEEQLHGTPLEQAYVTVIVAAVLTITVFLPLSIILKHGKRNPLRYSCYADLVPLLLWLAVLATMSSYHHTFHRTSLSSDQHRGWRCGVAATVLSGVEFLLFLTSTCLSLDTHASRSREDTTTPVAPTYSIEPDRGTSSSSSSPVTPPYPLDDIDDGRAVRSESSTFALQLQEHRRASLALSPVVASDVSSLLGRRGEDPSPVSAIDDCGGRGEEISVAAEKTEGVSTEEEEVAAEACFDAASPQPKGKDSEGSGA